jgi:hypothetical protein
VDGLTAATPTTRPVSCPAAIVVHRFGAKQVSWIQVNRDLAYVQLMDANTSNGEGYAVMDLRSGRVPDKSTGNVPELLVPARV